MPKFLDRLYKRFPAGKYVDQVKTGTDIQKARAENLRRPLMERTNVMRLVEENHVTERITALLMGQG